MLQLHSPRRLVTNSARSGDEGPKGRCAPDRIGRGVCAYRPRVGRSYHKNPFSLTTPGTRETTNNATLYRQMGAIFERTRRAVALALSSTCYAKRGEERLEFFLLGRVRNAWLAGDAGNRARAGKATTTYESRLADADCRRRSSTATAATAVQRDQPFDARMRVTLRCAATLRRPSLLPRFFAPSPANHDCFYNASKKVVSATKGRVPFPAVFFPRKGCALAGTCQRREI